IGFLLCQKALRVSGERSETRDPGAETRELDILSPLGPGSRSGSASASAGTRKACGAGPQDGPPLKLLGAGADHLPELGAVPQDRKSTRLNSSHTCISYAVFCLN